VGHESGKALLAVGERGFHAPAAHHLTDQAGG
jgi:hypothetical protein